jgi:hypothetical protein
MQTRLGHASAKVTLDTYGHLFPKEEERTRAAIEDTLGAALGAAVSDRCHEGVTDR